MVIGIVHDATIGDPGTPGGRVRNVHWEVDGWTVSYLYRWGGVRQVWIWQTGVEHNCHYLTPNPVEVRDAIEAYAIVSKALGNDSPRP